jgi:PAS domain S-box-containing protein
MSAQLLESLIPNTRCCVYLRTDQAQTIELRGSGLSELLGNRTDVPAAADWQAFQSEINPEDLIRIPKHPMSFGDTIGSDWDIYQLRIKDAADRWATLRFHDAEIGTAAGGDRVRVGVAIRLERAAEFTHKCLFLDQGWRSLAMRLPVLMAQLDASANPVYANELAEALLGTGGAFGSWQMVMGAGGTTHLGRIALDALTEAIATGQAVSHITRHEDTDVYAALHFIPVVKQSGLSTSVLVIGHVFQQGVVRAQAEVRPGLSEVLHAAVSDPVIVADAVTGQLLDANPAATITYGWPRAKLLQLRWDDLIADACESTLTHRTPSEPGVTFSHHRRRGGASFPVEARENTLVLKGRSIVISTIRDVTERLTAERQQSQLEARLQQAQKLESLGVLAGGIAHDFNNLLSGILGSLDFVGADLPPQSELSQSLTLARECAERAAVLCDQLLAYSGRGRFVVKPVSLNTVVEELRPLLEISLVSKPCLTFEFEPDLPLIEVDLAQMRQVVLNLVMNAAEATRAGSGHVTVRSRLVEVRRDELSQYLMGEQLTDGKYVSLEVSDDGCGMDEPTLARIFEPFFTTKFAGRGLGLPALMGIVRGHRGAIQVVSNAGRGSRFRVLFPIPRRRISEMSHAPPTLNWQGFGCVLFADDELPVRSVGRRILERLGFEVILAQNGRAAVDEFARQPDIISLVILDLTMPEMTGEEALREIRKMRPDIPIVLTSGYGEEEVLERLAYTSIDAFLKKPFRMEDFTNLIQSVLKRRSVNGISFESPEPVRPRLSVGSRAQGDR